MRRFAILSVGFLLVVTNVFAQSAPVTTRSNPPDPTKYQWVEVASGFQRPLYVTNAGDGSGRLFVVEQVGRIWVVKDGQVQPKPLLDIRSIVNSASNERGLLGLAFDPKYKDNGIFYVHYSDRNGDTAIARYHVSADNPDAADPSTAKVILHVQQPYANHNGGQLAFGPDGYLYIGLGDGGSQGDPHGNGQNSHVLLGKILRIDVSKGDTYSIPPDNPFADGKNGAPEVWAMGLRNPWRFSFDRATGDLYIGDVGQNQWEEVDFQPAGSPGGANYGWNIMEGNHPYSRAANPGSLVMPIAEYDHGQGIAVTGGYVYRGKALPDLQGVYFFADYGSGRMWTTYRDGSNAWNTTLFMDTGKVIPSFGEDEAGELYLTDFNSGGIFQLAAAG
jgi:glucose/arabinose dehydrogenase